MRKLSDWWRRMVNKLGGKVVTSLVAAMLLTLVAVAFTDSWIVAIGAQDANLRVINNTIRDVERLRADMFRAESVQRGFLLTQRNVYVTPFDDVVDDARQAIKTITENLSVQKNTIDPKHDLLLLQEVAGKVENKVSEMKLTLTLTRSGRIVEAKQLVNLDQGLVDMQLFVKNTQLLIDHQLTIREEIRAKRNNNVAMSRISLIGAATALSVLVTVVIKQLLNEISKRDQLSRSLAEEREKLESELSERKALLETLAVDYQYDVERERRLLARELHDELGSILTATKMDITWVMRKIKEIAPESSDKLAKTIRYIDQGIQFKRRIVQDLHPSMLSTFGLFPAIEAMIQEAGERNNWQLDIVLPDASVQLKEALGLIAYRIVQETLNNATKYAQASKVSVSLMVDDTHLKLEIEDNGVGMDMAQLGDETHGLSGMRHRVMAIGGRMEILSEVSKGVVTRVLIPLRPAGDVKLKLG